MKKLILFLLVCSFGFAEKAADNFNVSISTTKADLNKDKLSDLVVVSQDTLADTWPFKLQVFLGQPGGKRKLLVSSTKAIEPQYPDGRDGRLTGGGFEKIEIRSGVMWISNVLLRGHFVHKFRFQHDHFELIGFTYVNSDGLGEITEVDFNLSTGQRRVKKTNYENDKVTSDETKKVVIKPLPRLENFEPFGNEMY